MNDNLWELMLKTYLAAAVSLAKLTFIKLEFERQLNGETVLLRELAILAVVLYASLSTGSSMPIVNTDFIKIS